MADNEKLEEKITFQLFNKITQCILQARIQDLGGPEGDPNTWFNCVTRGFPVLERELAREKRATDQRETPIPLGISVYFEPRSHPAQQQPQRSLIEHWQLCYERLSAQCSTSVTNARVAQVYQRATVLCRSVHALLRQMPAFDLFWECKKNKLMPASMHYELCRDTLSHFVSNVSEFNFGTFETLCGRFSLSVSYMKDCSSLKVLDSDALINSRVIINDYVPSSPEAGKPIFARDAAHAHSPGTAISPASKPVTIQYSRSASIFSTSLPNQLSPGMSPPSFLPTSKPPPLSPGSSTNASAAASPTATPPYGLSPPLPVPHRRAISHIGTTSGAALSTSPQASNPPSILQESALARRLKQESYAARAGGQSTSPPDDALQFKRMPIAPKSAHASEDVLQISRVPVKPKSSPAAGLTADLQALGVSRTRISPTQDPFRPADGTQSGPLVARVGGPFECALPSNPLTASYVTHDRNPEGSSVLTPLDMALPFDPDESSVPTFICKCKNPPTLKMFQTKILPREDILPL